MVLQVWLHYRGFLKMPVYFIILSPSVYITHLKVVLLYKQMGSAAGEQK